MDAFLPSAPFPKLALLRCSCFWPDATTNDDDDDDDDDDADVDAGDADDSGVNTDDDDDKNGVDKLAEDLSVGRCCTFLLRRFNILAIVIDLHWEKNVKLSRCRCFLVKGGKRALHLKDCPVRFRLNKR
jgi:hypothetical protein